MFDATAPTSLRVAEQLANQSLREKLIKIACWSTNSPLGATDLVHDALVRVLDPGDQPWDPEKGTLLTHMTYVMRQAWADRARRLGNHEIPLDELARNARGVSDEPSPDSRDGHRASAVAEILFERLLMSLEEERPLAAQCLELMSQGIMTPRAQAEQLACPVEDIYEANRFLRRQAERIRDEWHASEEARMRALRQGALGREVS
jgi:DNA-directed RNA polymerase specialized sigma24 family protein